jgi:hypothetical protein
LHGCGEAALRQHAARNVENHDAGNERKDIRQRGEPELRHERSNKPDRRQTQRQNRRRARHRTDAGLNEDAAIFARQQTEIHGQGCPSRGSKPMVRWRPPAQLPSKFDCRPTLSQRH